MSIWSTLWKSAPNQFLLGRNTAPAQRLARVGAASAVAAYLVVASAAYVSTLAPSSLSMRIGSCGDRTCVSWVMPAGKAWTQGARPGMKVISIDGQSVAVGVGPSFSSQPKRQARVVSDDGEILQLVATELLISTGPLKFSMWLLGSAFALLAAAVVVRRPDLPAARRFALFAAFAAVGLAVGPSSGGPAPTWALGVQVLTLAGIGITFAPFVVALIIGEPSARVRGVIRSFEVLGLTIIIAYASSVGFNASWYSVVRPVLFFYVAGSILGGVTIMVLGAFWSASPQGRRQARIAALGTSLGTTPFVVLTLVPEAISSNSWLPASILPLGLMPLSFAYAIVQHQLMGVRRLVHRGMVYGIATTALLAFVTAALAMMGRTEIVTSGMDSNSGFIAVLVVVGVLVFFVLRWAARWLVDHFIYRETVDYTSLLQAVDTSQPQSGGVGSVAQEVAERICAVLDLESVLLFLGPDLDRSTLAAAVGERSSDVLQYVAPRASPSLRGLRGAEIGEMRWESNTLLLANLTSSGRYRGHVLLGPKAGGEIFVDDEKHVVASIIPVIAMAIEKSELAEDLRQLGRRLVRTQETERARVAYDLHDGPLQKAMMLAGDFALSGTEHQGLAKQLADELREVCAHLRPAILDDLGIISALEWLVLDAVERHQTSAAFHAENLADDVRFGLDLELVLFRVTQEAITNVLKHARAEHLSVTLSREAGSVILKVEDDGVGFSVSGLTKDGMGLPGMRDRLTQLNGTFDIRSEPGAGTTVTISIPLQAHESGAEVLDATSLARGHHR